MEDKPKIEKPWWRDGVIIFVKVSGYIAIPVILASIIGKSLDRKYNSDPFIFLSLVMVAFATTISLIWREMRVYKSKIEKEEKIINYGRKHTSSK